MPGQHSQRSNRRQIVMPTNQNCRLSTNQSAQLDTYSVYNSLQEPDLNSQNEQQQQHIQTVINNQQTANQLLNSMTETGQYEINDLMNFCDDDTDLNENSQLSSQHSQLSSQHSQLSSQNSQLSSQNNLILNQNSFSNTTDNQNRFFVLNDSTNSLNPPVRYVATRPQTQSSTRTQTQSSTRTQTQSSTRPQIQSTTRPQIQSTTRPQIQSTTRPQTQSSTRSNLTASVNINQTVHQTSDSTTEYHQESNSVNDESESSNLNRFLANNSGVFSDRRRSNLPPQPTRTRRTRILNTQSDPTQIKRYKNYVDFTQYEPAIIEHFNERSISGYIFGEISTLKSTENTGYFSSFDSAFMAGLMCQRNRGLLTNPGPTELAFKIGNCVRNRRKKLNQERLESNLNRVSRFSSTS